MIDQLITDFLKKYGAGDASTWTDKEFENASDVLFSKTQIRISVNTLKRLFGKIQTQKDYKPQNASLNALSKYLGYESYYEYKKNAPAIREQNLQTVSQKRYLLFTIGFVLLFLLAFTAIFFYYQKQIENLEEKLQNGYSDEEVILKLNPFSSDSATTATFIYEVSEKLYQEGGGFFLDGESYPLEQSRTIISKKFTNPGIYRGRVVIGDSIYKAQSFSILSNGWIFLNGSTQFNDINRGSNLNKKVEAKIIKDFYIPDSNFELELQYDSIVASENIANQLKIKLKLVFDHDEAFFVFYGDDIINHSPFNSVGGKFYPELNDSHLIKKGDPLHIKVIGGKNHFTTIINGKEAFRFPKNKQMGDLRMIGYESRRYKVTLKKFSVSTRKGKIYYDLLGL